MSISQWMSWDAGVDLVALTTPTLPMPNIIIHVARMVHTPVGSAPAGMILFQPDPNAAPVAMGFISSSLEVARYFGPAIFAGTPFEKAPALLASIEIVTQLPGTVSATVTVGSDVFQTTLTGLKTPELIHRVPAAMPPFYQQGLESAATGATLTLNGKPVSIVVPPVGITGGPAAVWSPAGIYAR